MERFEIGIRKYVENEVVRYWLMINAKPTDVDEKNQGLKLMEKNWTKHFRFFYNSPWIYFILLTIIVNFFISLATYFSSGDIFTSLVTVIVIMHLTCVIYWIDFIAGVTVKVINLKHPQDIETKSIAALTTDAISLLPLSTVYLIAWPHPNTKILWWLRAVTLLRIYRIPQFLTSVATVERNYWILTIFVYTIYTTLLTSTFAVVWDTYNYQKYEIIDWDKSLENKLIVTAYFSVATTFSLGIGDILPEQKLYMFLCSLAMICGFIMVKGIINGVLTTAFVNSESERENYRREYESTIGDMKNRKVNKKVIEKISRNLSKFWYLKKSVNNPKLTLLPLSLSKEIYFDINFGFLSRSLIFSMQPRSFLRSVSLMMHNVTFLPGDTILETFGMAQAMLCVSSGVIEVLSQENDSTPIVSFTTGTIIGESALFISYPNKCIVRASTVAELQVLTAKNFSRLALRFPEIYRSMRKDVIDRIQKIAKPEYENVAKEMERELVDLTRRKALKHLLQELKVKSKGRESSAILSMKSNLLSLYVLSENIPRVKTLPINLIRKKPWILRPNTTLMNLWDGFIFVVVVVVSYTYPIMAGFVREISTAGYTLLFVVECIYIVDLYIECTKAIERKDHFTYETTIKGIVAQKLKTVGFYLDIFSTYELTVYSKLLYNNQPEYSHLLFSLNRVLKAWRIPKYFLKLENIMGSKLLILRMFKYMLYYSLMVVWVSVILYIASCPTEYCVISSWFAKYRKQEVKNSNPAACSEWPALVSIYWGSTLTSTLAYGDIRPKTVTDCLVLVICFLFGAIILTYCSAEASATLKHREKYRSQYQEEVIAVIRFMKEHNISKDLQTEVKNYFSLQWIYDRGYIMRHHQILDNMPLQQREIVISEVLGKLMNVPLFKYTNTNFLRLLATFVKLRVLPPNEVFIISGTYAREMFIIESGYIEISNEEYRAVLRPASPIGYFEMILGKAMSINATTLTHVRLLSLDYVSYARAVTTYPSVKADVTSAVESFNTIWEKEGSQIYGYLYSGPQNVEGDAWVKKKVLSSECINVYKYHKKMGTSYWEPFKHWGKLRFFQFLLLPIAISPHSVFIRVWEIFRICCSVLACCVIPIHYSIRAHTGVFLPVVWILHAVCWIDMFIMFHVAYYDRRGILMFHPAKTATWYLKGSFVLDLISTFPISLVIDRLYPRSENLPSLYHDGPGFIMVLQFYKFFQCCHFMEGNILKPLSKVKVIKFLPLALIAANIITGFLILFICRCALDDVREGIEKVNLLGEFQHDILVFCTMPDASVTSDSTPLRFYLIAYYWVVATMVTCGFGDLAAKSKTTMIAVILIVSLSIFLYGYMFASITSSMLGANVVITKYRKRIKEMTRFMKQMNADAEIERRLILHYMYNWRRTEGSSPQKTFAYVHPTLRNKIVASMYEETIQQVSAFLAVERPVVRVLGQNLNEMYFLQGETIINYKDMQEDIYMIYRGQVNVLSRTGSLILRMGSGGLFGNISKKQYSVSSVIVRAGTNVDLLRLNSQAFFKSLEVSTNTKGLVDQLLKTTNDYVPPLANVEVPENDDILPYEIAMTKTSGPDIQFIAGDIADINKFFYLGHSIFKPPGQGFATFVFMHNSWFYQMIETSTLALSYISCALGSYMFAFQHFHQGIMTFSFTTDIFFFWRIWIQLNLTYSDKYGNFVINKQKIKERYIHRRIAVGIDMAANIPIDMFVALLASERYLLMIMSIVRLNRLIRLYYIVTIFESKFKVLMVNKTFLKISSNLCYSSLMLHFLACLWFFIARPLNKNYDESWVNKKNIPNDDYWSLYFLSFYYIINLCTTAGCANVPISMNIELLFAVVLMIVCSFGVAILVGSMAGIMNVNSISMCTYQETIIQFRNSLIRQNISRYQLVKMWNYVLHLWSRENGKQIPKFIENAPYVMRCEVMTSMFGQHLYECYIFSNLEPAFLNQLSIHLKRYVYFSGNYIVQQGDIDHTMYFIHRGQVSVLTIHPDLSETIHFKLIEKDHFGMKQGLIVGTEHYFSYRAETNTEILSLTYSHWQHLLKYFPDVGQIIFKRLQFLPNINESAAQDLTKLLV